MKIPLFLLFNAFSGLAEIQQTHVIPPAQDHFALLTPSQHFNSMAICDPYQPLPCLKRVNLTSPYIEALEDAADCYGEEHARVLLHTPADETYQRTLAQNMQQAYYQLGMIAKEKKAYAHAKTYFSYSIDHQVNQSALAATTIDAHYALALIYYEEGAYNMTIQSLTDLLQAINGTTYHNTIKEGYINLYLALAYHQKGDIEQRNKHFLATPHFTGKGASRSWLSFHYDMTLALFRNGLIDYMDRHWHWVALLAEQLNVTNILADAYYISALCYYREWRYTKYPAKINSKFFEAAATTLKYYNSTNITAADSIYLKLGHVYFLEQHAYQKALAAFLSFSYSTFNLNWVIAAAGVLLSATAHHLHNMGMLLGVSPLWADIISMLFPGPIMMILLLKLTNVPYKNFFASGYPYTFPYRKNIFDIAFAGPDKLALLTDDGMYLRYFSGDRCGLLEDLSKGETITKVVFSQNYATFGFVGQKRLGLGNMATKELLFADVGHVKDIAISPCGEFLLYLTGNDMYMKMLNSDLHHCVCRFPTPPCSVDWAVNGNLVVVALDNRMFTFVPTSHPLASQVILDAIPPTYTDRLVPVDIASFLVQYLALQQISSLFLPAQANFQVKISPASQHVVALYQKNVAVYDVQATCTLRLAKQYPPCLTITDASQISWTPDSPKILVMGKPIASDATNPKDVVCALHYDGKQKRSFFRLCCCKKTRPGILLYKWGQPVRRCVFSHDGKAVAFMQDNRIVVSKKEMPISIKVKKGVAGCLCCGIVYWCISVLGFMAYPLLL